MKSENYGSVVQKAVEQIKQFLFTSDLKKGEHLPTEKELCQQLGVGRNSLREALRILASTGYITLEPGRGAFVRRTRGNSGRGGRYLLVQPKSGGGPGLSGDSFRL